MKRRDFMILGSVGFGSTLISMDTPEIYANQAAKEKSIIWVWLGGGPTHFELFNASTNNLVGFDEYKPVPVKGSDGFIVPARTKNYFNNGIKLGGGFADLINYADKLNVVANFSHKDSSHLQATHWMNTAHYNPDRTTTAASKYPSHGSLVSAVYGPNNANGVPHYVSQGKIQGDEPAWLGGAYGAFDPRAKDNLSPRVELDRLSDRRSLLAQLDKSSISKPAVDEYKNQAFDTILGDAKKAFDETHWDKEKGFYGDTQIGKQLWMAHRLTYYGTKFVTIHYGGWDMHSNIKEGLESRVPPLDKALSALILELSREERLNDVMIVVTGEFGRTRLNASNGRDHWPSLTPLLLVGGNYPSGRVIGKSDKYNYEPDDNPYGPIDLQATMFHHLGIDPGIQRLDNSGRPRYLLEGHARNILV